MHAQGCAAETVRLLFLDETGKPPGHPEHQIAYDHVVVDICPACNGATLEKLDHDCFDFEDVWDQYEWYELTPEDGARLRTLAAECPRPLDPGCSCGLHRSLRSSANRLPSSSWDHIFEAGSHRHLIALSDGKSPSFQPAGVAAGSREAVGQADAAGRSTIWIVLATWLVVLSSALVLYYAAADLPWILDVVITAVLIPGSFLGAVFAIAFARVVIDTLTPKRT